jgi:trk system potassium uptake protein TrkH
VDLSSPIVEASIIHPSTLGAIRRVAFLLSSLLLCESATLGIPLAIAMGAREQDAVRAFTTTIFIGGAAGVAGFVLFRTDLAGLTRREGFAIVAFGWLLVCALGCLPFVFVGVLGPVDAWFECVSGFTGTGSSVFRDVEALPKGILFWRSFTHWLGGMGFVALYIALFPLLGVGATHVYRAESPGLEVDRLRPRISSTARILWLIYAGLSSALVLLLFLGGMSWFDAFCQMFGAIGTGGFSTKNASIGYWHSAYIDWVIVLFLWLSATNYGLWWAVILGRPRTWLGDPEWRFFTAVLVSCGFFVGLVVWATSDTALTTAIRNGFFEVVSTGTTTGFATADYEKWPPVTQYVLFLLLFMGGSAGSTAGAMKAIRVLLFSKQALRSLFATLHPYAVTPPRLAGRVVDPTTMRAVSAFMGMYLLTWAFAVFGVSLTDVDFATALSAVATAMGGVGPGLANIGPYDNFAWMNPAAKGILSFCMLAGRLELITLMLPFSPAFWRR